MRRNQCYSPNSIQRARYALKARREAEIATSTDARRHISARVSPDIIEAFESVRKERGQSRSAAIEEAMREFALGRAEAMGIRAAGVAERVEGVADAVAEEGEAGRDLAKAHRKSLGGLLVDNRYALESIYALLEQVFPRAEGVKREDMREVAHRRIQAERKQVREEAEARDGDGA